jgi:hypothetical protein
MRVDGTNSGSYAVDGLAVKDLNLPVHILELVILV